MRVALPSNNSILVDLVQPTFGVLKSLCDIEHNILVKNALVRACCSSDIDNFSIQDRDYLFFLCLSSIYSGKLTFPITCECEEKFSETLKFSDFEIFDLKSKDRSILTFTGWRLYKYKILTVKDEEWCTEKAISWEGYDESLIRDLLISKVISNVRFDYSSKEKFVKSLKRISFRAYNIAANFDRLTFHGVLPYADVKCPKCGKDIKLTFYLEGGLALLNSSDITKRFASVSEVLSYEDFLKLTIPEYNFFVDSLNEQNKQKVE